MLFALLLALACSGDKDTGSTAVVDSGNGDTGEEVYPPIFGAEVRLQDEGFTLTLIHPELANYSYFGLVNTINTNIGTFEDCLNGQVRDSVTYSFCHPITLDAQNQQAFSLFTVEEEDTGVDLSTAFDVNANTFYYDSSANQLTYILWDARSNACITWGADVRYYTESRLACTETARRDPNDTLDSGDSGVDGG